MLLCFLFSSLPGFRFNKSLLSSAFLLPPPSIYSFPLTASSSLRIFDFNCFIAMSAPVELKVYPATPARYIESIHMAPGVVLNKEKNEANISTPANNFFVKWEKIEEDCWILYTQHQFKAPVIFDFQSDPAGDMIQLDFGLRLPAYVIEAGTLHYRCEKTVALWSNYSAFKASMPATPNTESIRLLLGRSFLQSNIAQALESFLQTPPGKVIAGASPVFTRPLTPGEQYLLHKIFDFFLSTRKATATLSIKQMAIDLIRQFVEISLDMAKPVEEKAVSMRIADTIAYLEQQIFSKFPGIEALSSRAGLCATHFKSAFKSQTGQSPFAFFRQRQMEFAINALKSGQYNVKEIALLLQFDNPSNFTRSFRQFNGVAPSHFAGSNGTNDAP